MQSDCTLEVHFSVVHMCLKCFLYAVTYTVQEVVTQEGSTLAMQVERTHAVVEFGNYI